jgi:hypothetical protein
MRAAVGMPALVHTPERASAYWLVPFVERELANGFARVELTGRVTQLGTFGSGADDIRSWPKASFFEAPPTEILEEIQRLHPDIVLREPLFTYDRSPSHWGWRVDLGSGGVIAFIWPHGWSLRRPT